ncbi:superkiller [Coniochaeta pulveracea]|uniref:Superkiller n=1 Tax=Coniochaeta pulveracea TaxID=177199 RepID=A0A420Y128_9PEZI|nr:superkiller [Coniochaeta pulveracea]
MINHDQHQATKNRKSTAHGPIVATMSKQYLTLHTLDNAHTADIYSLAATPNSLFSVGGSSTIHIYSTVTSATFPLVQSITGAHRLGIHHVATSRGGPGHVAVTAGFGGELKVWTCKESGDWVLFHEFNPQGSSPPWAIALSADENYLAASTEDGRIVVYDLVEKTKVQTYETGSASTGGGPFGLSVDLSRDGRLTASGHQNGSVYVFNNDTGRMVYSLSGLAKPVRAVAFSPGCKRLAAAGDAGIIALYDMEHGEHVGNMGGAGLSNAWITSLDWNETGEYLLTGSFDGKVRVWDVARGECVATHSETREALWSVRWLPKSGKALAPGMSTGEMFATAGAHRSITFYREATGP